MADQKISGLVTADPLVGTELVEVVQVGVNKKATISNIGTSLIIDEDSFASDSATKAPSQQSTKAFIEDRISANLSGLSWKQTAEVRTTANITLAGEQTLDGILTSGSRVLVMNQTAPAENGIYVSSAGAWSRSTDCDASSDFQNAVVSVSRGTLHADTSWRQTADSVTVGTTAIVWVAFGAAGVTGSFTTNRIPYATGGSTLGDDSALTWDPTNDSLTIGFARIHTKTNFATSPNESLFIGKNAGNFTNSGDDNIGIGGNALLNLTTGTANTVMGNNAGIDVSSGNSNTLIGSQAGTNVTTGNQNTIIGAGAGDLETTGLQNTILGASAGTTQNGAHGNVLLGYGAGFFITTGSRNVGVGFMSLGESLTVGTDNVAVGHRALDSVTGTGNVGIGADAGENVTSGSQNVIIGYGIDAQSSTASGQLSIQNIIFGINNTATGTTVSSGSIGIGVPAPAAKLDLLSVSVGTNVLKYASTAINDDPAVTILQNRVATTDATITTLQTVLIPASTTVTLEMTVVARRTGGIAGTAEDGASYKRMATYKNVAGVATLIGSISTIHAVEDQAGWDATFAPSGGNVLIQVAGAIDNDITWHLSELKRMQVST